ncbi:MAG: hypothetical protein EXR79_17440 [Myxococcales bacterium]|nr:hypothetical protein [Myxococcales bacterium]
MTDTSTVAARRFGSVHAGPARTDERSTSGVFQPTVVPAVRNYEELDGAHGREVFFRPERYRAADLLPLQPEVVLPDVAAPCAVIDLSSGGIAFEWPAGRPLPTSHLPVHVDVRAGSRSLYCGLVRLSSVRRTSDHCEVVGAQVLGGGQIDVTDVLHLRDVRRLALDTHPEHGAAPVLGREAFRAGVADFRIWLEDLSDELARAERTLPWSVVHGETSSLARDELRQWVLETIVPRFVRTCGDLDRCLRGAAPEDGNALKVLSQRHLHALLMEAPVLHRCYHKPLGYAGDFEVMRFIYERWFEGPTLFARALNTAAVALPGAAAVRSRKDMLLRELSATAAAWTGGPLRVVSVAAGPAQEVYEFLSAISPDGPRVDIVLFDQDKQALALAHARIERRIERRGLGTRIRVTYLHDSIKRLLHDATLFAGFGPFHLVFCAGLFDYLPVRTAGVLTRNFWDNLAPGGRAFIGNMVPTSPSRWIMEHHMDWSLIYRTPAEMVDMARTAAPDCRLATIDDPTGVNPLLVMERV